MDDKTLVERLQEHERDHRSYHERIDGYHETVAAHKLADDLKEAADHIEELEAENDELAAVNRMYAKTIVDRDEEVEIYQQCNAKLEKVREAAKALFEKDIFWNPDSGGYDLAKPRGSMNELREALAACEDKDND